MLILPAALAYWVGRLLPVAWIISLFGIVLVAVVVLLMQDDPTQDQGALVGRGVFLIFVFLPAISLAVVAAIFGVSRRRRDLAEN